MSLNDIEKKQAHEAFVKDLPGGTLFETYITIILPILFYAFHCVLVVSFFQLTSKDLKGNLVLNFVDTVIPSILVLTVFSDFLYQIFFCLLLLLLIFTCNSLVMSKGTKFLSKIRISFHSPDQKGVGYLFVSRMRGYLLIMTSICILAVDMKAFSRRFAKTEFYGVSFMDVGVGAFSFVMGLIRYAKLSSSKRFRLQAVFILILLGAIRFVIVKFFNYQVHESEYGQHWNFFFTLAIIKLLGSLLGLAKSQLLSISATLIAVIALHYHLLVYHGLEKFCVDNNVNRSTSLIFANKEGLISLPGYFMLYLLGSLIGILFSKGFIWMTLLIITPLTFVLTVLNLFSISRRAANAGYIIWTTSASVWGLILFLLLDVLLNILEDRSNYVTKDEYADVYALTNRFGLFHFLFTNVLTGIVNVGIDTLELTSSLSVLCLSCYTAVPIVIIAFFGCKERSRYKTD